MTGTTTPVPAWQPGMFSGPIGEIVGLADPDTEADKVGVYAVLLAQAGVLIHTAPHVQIGNTRHPLLIWPLLIGRTNTGRKGEATATAERVSFRAAQELGDLTVSGLSSGEGLIERIRDQDNPDDKGGTEDKRLLVIEPEFANVMAVMGREGSTLPGLLRQAWEGRRLSSLTRQRLVASESHIGIIGNITPREFRAKMRATDLAGGTWNRFLPLYVERRKMLALPRGIDDDTLRSASKLFREAIDSARQLASIQLGKEATDLWRNQLYAEFSDFDEDDAVSDFVQRAAPYCRRISALLAALEGCRLEKRSHLESAAELVRYSIASAAFVLDSSPRDSRSDKLRRAVTEAGAAGLSRDEVMKLFARKLSAAELDDLAEQLCQDGDYEQVTMATKGRPTTRLIRRPK